jgi:beta-aspartyl-dipeptidase (metallo-type)
LDPALELLSGAEVWAPEPLGRRHVLVGGGRVLWIGGECPALPRALGAVETDLSGRRLVPGFIDLHAHLTGGGGEAGFASRVPPVALSRFTLGGITTAVGLLGTDDCVRTIGELVATARGLRELGLSAYAWTGGYHLPPATLTGSLRGDIVHVGPVIGVGELALSDHRSSQPTLDELLRAASDAHVAGLMSGKAGIVHLHLGDGPRGLELVRRALEASELPPRVFHPTHVNRRRELFTEALELAERGSAIDVTAFPIDEGAAGNGAWSAADAVRRYFESGLPPERLTLSTDAGGCLPAFDAEGRVARMGVGDPGALAATLGELVRGGMALERALLPITVNPARLLCLARKGRVRAGCDADLVALDPAGAVADVMVGGCWHVRAGKALFSGPFEPAG